MIINITFHFDHVGSIVCLSIFQGCIDPRHDFSHFLYCLLLLDAMYNIHIISLVRTIFIHVIFLTYPKIYGMIPWPISQGLHHFLITLRWLPLLICLRSISDKMWLESFLPLIHISFLIVIPSPLESWLSSVLLIQILGFSYGFL